MFRPQIIRRGLSLVKNVHTTPRSQLVNSAVRDGHEVLHIQRVRFARPSLFSRRRFIAFALYSAGTAAVVHHFLGADEEESVEEEHERIGKHHRSDKGRREDGDRQTGTETDKEYEVEEDDEEITPLLSIPIGLARAKKQEYYGGSSPEWQEFKKIAQDRKRLTDTKKLLADKVRAHAAREMPQFVRYIGAIDTRKGGVWIETSFPNGPPLEYERPVLAIDDKLDVYYTTQTVHAEHYWRFNLVAYPTAAFTSVYELSKFKIWQGWQTVKSYAGYPERTPQIGATVVSILPTSKNPPSRRLTSESANQTSRQITNSSASSGSASSTTSPSSQQSTSTSKSSQDGQLTSSPPSTPNPNVAKLNLPVNPDPSMFTTTIGGFRNTYRKRVGPRPFIAPRGTIVLSGLVQLVGDRGSMTVEVDAAFSPQHDQFQRIDYKVRSVHPSTQYPSRR